MWIHEDKEWPNFKWDIHVLASKLAFVRHKQGFLLGQIERLGFEFKSNAWLMTLTNDVVKSFAIEDENLDPKEVRSSIARRLELKSAGVRPANRTIDGIVEMMLEATQNYSSPLTEERLFGWHAALFPNGRSGLNKINVGSWRTKDADPMQVVSSPFGKEKIHFEAPRASRLKKEMGIFLKWFEGKNQIDPVLKAGISHFWFVTLHPFEDGNGRIVRAIGDLALARADGRAERFYSLSTQIESERKSYYEILEAQQRSSVDITKWLFWFLDCFEKSIHTAENSLKKILFKAKFFEELNKNSLNSRQLLILNRMFEDDFEGFMNTSKYAKMAKCSNDSALRDIQELKNMGILSQNPSGGRSTSYYITKLKE